MSKKLLNLFIAILAMTICSACSSDNGSEPAQKIRINSVVPTEVSGDGGDVTVNILADRKPEYKIDAPWITFKGYELKNSNHSFTFTVSANPGDARESVITFTAKGDTQTATVKQSRKPDPVPETPDDPQPEPDTNLPMLGLGWNLGNQFDAHVNEVANETCWGNPAATQALFDKLAAVGLTSVRIPVTWLGHIGAAPDYKLDDKWMARVKEVVGYAEHAGLKVIMNIHHDGADSAHWLDIKRAATDDAVNTQIKAQLAAMWTQIALAFSDKGDFLIFEPFNEIHDGGWGWGDNIKDNGKQYRIVNEWNQVFVDAVRATGGNNATRYLAVVGYCANPALTIANLVLPKDAAADRLIVSVHFYDPTDFTLEAKYSEWGHTGAASNKANRGDESNVRDVFGKLKAAYVDKGIPVYIGEAGCVHRSSARGENFRKYYLEYVTKAARDYGLAILIWDNGSTGAGKECHGYFKHSDGSYINNAEQMITAMTHAYYTNDKAFTLQSVYDNAPK